MPKVTLSISGLTVHLSPLEKILALRSDLTVAFADISAAYVEWHPWLAEGLFRLSSITNVAHYNVHPGYGTYPQPDGSWNFLAVRIARPAVSIDIAKGTYKRIILSVSDPEETAKAIAGAAGVEPSRVS
jgi:hypothetical protein